MFLFTTDSSDSSLSVNCSPSSVFTSSVNAAPSFALGLISSPNPQRISWRTDCGSPPQPPLCRVGYWQQVRFRGESPRRHHTSFGLHSAYHRPSYGAVPCAGCPSNPPGYVVLKYLQLVGKAAVEPVGSPKQVLNTQKPRPKSYKTGVLSSERGSEKCMKDLSTHYFILAMHKLCTSLWLATLDELVFR